MDETIITTPTHTFYVLQKGWMEAVQLRAAQVMAAAWETAQELLLVRDR